MSQQRDVSSNESTEHNASQTERETRWSRFWDGKPGFGLALGLVALVAGVMIFGNLSALGIWEPWEAHEIQVAKEYAERPTPAPEVKNPTDPSYNWAVPTLDQKPVERSLLKVWTMSKSLASVGGDGELAVGQLEFSSRLPMAIGVFVLSILGFLWLRRHFSTWPALLGTLGFISTPGIFMGVHSASSEMFYVVTTTAAIMAFIEVMYAESKAGELMWGVGFGVALGLAFLDQRFFGLLMPLSVIVGFGVTQLPFHRGLRAHQLKEEGERFLGKFEIGLAATFAVGALATVGWGVLRSSGADDEALFLPHVEQWMAILIPTFVLLAGAGLARRTRVIERLRGVGGMLGLGICAAIAASVLVSYADANPVLLKNGEVFGEVPVLTYALENHLFGDGMPGEYNHFGLWIRTLGFTLLIPWGGLVLLAVGYLARSTRLTDDEGTIREEVLSRSESLKRLFLLWGFFGVAVVAYGSMFGHYFYPAYFPLLAGVGLMLADRPFWKRMRISTLLPYLMGFAALMMVLILGKDIQRFPARFFEAYAMYQEELGLPEDFSFGSEFKALKYAWLGLFSVFFFGLVSWAVLTYHNTIALPGRLIGWWRRWRSDDASDEERNPEPWTAVEVPEADSDDSPARLRALEKEAIRDGDGVVSAVARFFEEVPTWPAVVAAAGVATGAAFLFYFAPQLGHHLSQRGIFETYVQMRSEGEKLYRYRVSTSDTSLYLDDVERLAGSQGFINKFDEEERFFAVIPRKRLAKLNHDVRKRYDKNIPVHDARSSRLLLVSNKLEDGEENKSFVAEAIVEDPSEIQHEVLFETDDGEAHPTFDNRLELVGYSLDHHPETGLPTYGWGDNAQLTTYFRVKRSVPSNYQIFLHVDRSGSRIHGDHYPVHGDYPTDEWNVGDIVKDEYVLNIDMYSTPGTYTIYLGFYRSGRRMKVSPDNAHDGGNRVPMGKIKVEGF